MSRIVTAHVGLTMPDGSRAARTVNVSVPPLVYETDEEQAAATDQAASRALQRAASDVIAVLDLPEPTPEPVVTSDPEPTPSTREDQSS